MNAPEMCQEILADNHTAANEGLSDWLKVVQNVSGGDKYATIIVETEDGSRFNIAVSQITKGRGQKPSYV